MTVGSRFNYCNERFNSAVINDVWPELWFFSFIAVALCCINQYTEVNFTLSTTLLTVLGTVLGLVLCFCTSLAYDRYWEVRKLWGNIALASRKLGMIIWVHVPLEREVNEGENADDIQLRALIERKSMVNLVQAFSVSVKHFLRSEPGISYKDLYPLLSSLPQSVDESHKRSDEGSSKEEPDDMPASLPMWQESPLSTSHTAKSRKKGFDPGCVLPNVESAVQLAPARNQAKETAYDIFPPFIIFLPIHTMIKKLVGTHHGDEDGSRNIFGKKKDLEPIESNIPLEISLFLFSYMEILLRDKLLDPAIATEYDNTLVSMQDSATNLQRICSTPIPFAYLRVSIWLFLLFLPLEIYSSFKWLTIPCTALICFLYVGILETGQGIENPSNYDGNHLDMDHFCLQIQRDLAQITGHPSGDQSGFIFSQFNQPFAPQDRRSAIEILRKDP
ncbi:hypothetical protein M407DRAFT_27078 [Tulasnella calospora MUT 4182]|uniref:Uncharacterized protein n=1 Tax=Tulasnella calospora MUT 4182 TaxID=1051891 RepID=A0A0C3KQ24_9AGAM|nr:hypothetical protein M407DRAFT_27078 [Tulasnella calospora MUT 4182]